MKRTDKGVKPENRGNGSWRIIICRGYDAAGKKQRKYKTIHLNPGWPLERQEREACRQRDRLQDEFDQQKIAGTKAITLKEYCSEWIETYCERKELSPGTIANYQNLLDTRILPQLGRVKLQDLDARTINKFLAGLKKEGLSGTYARKYYTLLRTIMGTALREQLVAINIMERIEAPAKDTKERPFYNISEVQAFVKALENEPIKWKAFMLLSLASGMRRGEEVGLNWNDIDFHEKRITIRRAAAYAKGRGTFLKGPKSESGNRTISIDSNTLAVLSEWRKQQNQERLICGSDWSSEPDDIDSVFTQEDGKRMFLHSPGQWLERFEKRHELKPLNLHGLRHTEGSLLIANGADIVSVSHRHGHSRVSTTLDIYAHAYEERDSILADTMEKIITKQAE